MEYDILAHVYIGGIINFNKNVEQSIAKSKPGRE